MTPVSFEENLLAYYLGQRRRSDFTHNYMGGLLFLFNACLNSGFIKDNLS
jgi:hypothetical protein